MPDILSNWCVADGVVRLILFRVMPSHELEVGRLIERHSRAAGLHRNSFRVIRLFGTYDLMFIQDNASLAVTDFVKFGSIPFITASSEYVCYKWKSRGRQEPTFRISQFSKPLAALCFLKINPSVVQRDGIRAEIAFANFIRQHLPDVQMMGSLGWFEVLLLVSGASLGAIFQVIGKQLPKLIYEYRNPHKIFFAEKTLTLLGHDLDVSDPLLKKKNTAVTLFGDGLKKDDLSVHFSVACKPRAMALLENEAASRQHFGGKEKKLEVNFRFGPRDLDFTISLEKTGIKTLNQLLYKLDRFRRLNSDSLIKTYTDIQYRQQVPFGASSAEDPRGCLMFPLSPGEANRLASFGPEGAAVASAVYRYNSLIGNDVVADAFSDLLKYVKVTRRHALELDGDHNVSSRHCLIDRLKILKDAIDQRSQGVYTDFEESPFVLGATGAGLLRVLKALDAYVILLLRRFSKDWNGFVVCGNSSRFEHQSEAVIVPAEAALSAHDLWAVTHEVMHVLQHTCPKLLSAKAIFPEDADPTVSRYRLVGSAYWHLLHEVTADVLDFAICCPLQLDEYLDVIWHYLSDKVFEQQDWQQLRAYVFRSFAVICYAHSQTNKRQPSGWLTPNRLKQILNHKQSFFVRHAKLGRLLRNNSRGESGVQLLVQEFIAEVAPALPYVFQRVQEIQQSALSRRERPADIERQLALLRQGSIIPEQQLGNPETVTWNLARRGSPPLADRGTIAWMLSLWHVYHVRKLGFDFNRLLATRRPK